MELKASCERCPKAMTDVLLSMISEGFIEREKNFSLSSPACVFRHDQLPSASKCPLVPFAMEMRGKLPQSTPRLCVLTLSSVERNVWMVDNYQRAKATLLHHTWLEWVFASVLWCCFCCTGFFASAVLEILYSLHIVKISVETVITYIQKLFSAPG